MTRGARLVEILADAHLEEGHVDDAVVLGDADACRQKVANGLGRVAAPAEARDRRHARVVPAADEALLDELEELALAEDGVAQVEPGELDLLGVVDPELVEDTSRRAGGGPRTRGCRWSG